MTKFELTKDKNGHYSCARNELGQTLRVKEVFVGEMWNKFLRAMGWLGWLDPTLTPAQNSWSSG